MSNPFRNLVKKPPRHEKGEIVVADSGNVKEVAKIMIGFEALLRETQSYMSKACGNKLFDSDLKDAMRQLIKQYMKDHNYYVPNMTLAEAADRLYVEMAEYSFLTPLLARKDIEEININSWDDIQIIPSKGQQYKYSEHFSSAQHAVDVVRRMLHNEQASAWRELLPDLRHFHAPDRGGSNKRPVAENPNVPRAGGKYKRPERAHEVRESRAQSGNRPPAHGQRQRKHGRVGYHHHGAVPGRGGFQQSLHTR